MTRKFIRLTSVSVFHMCKESQSQCALRNWPSSFKSWSTPPHHSIQVQHRLAVFYSHILTLYKVRHEWLLERAEHELARRTFSQYNRKIHFYQIQEQCAAASRKLCWVRSFCATGPMEHAKSIVNRFSWFIIQIFVYRIGAKGRHYLRGKTVKTS